MIQTSTRDKLQDFPFLNRHTIAYIETLINKSTRVLEFGAGGSTIWFAQRVKKIVSFENSEKWFYKISDRLKDLGLDNADLFFDPLYWRPGLIVGEFDLIFIDGKKRLPCAKNSIGNLAEKGIVILDNSEYKKSRPAFDFLSSEIITSEHRSGLKKKSITSFFYKGGFYGRV